MLILKSVFLCFHPIVRQAWVSILKDLLTRCTQRNSLAWCQLTRISSKSLAIPVLKPATLVPPPTHRYNMTQNEMAGLEMILPYCETGLVFHSERLTRCTQRAQLACSGRVDFSPKSLQSCAKQYPKFFFAERHSLRRKHAQTSQLKQQFR